MIAATMIFALMLSGLAVIAAAAVERALRLLRRPARGVWLVAMLSTAVFASGALPSIAPPNPSGATDSRPVRPSVSVRSPASHGGRTMSADRLASWRWGGWSVDGSGWITRLDTALLILWSASSLAGIALLGWAAVALHRRSHGWDRATIGQTPVHVAPDVGPAVAGIVRPYILIPRWALALSPTDLDLMVLHETEHAKAGDPLMVWLARAAVCFQPWNPLAWYALHRLQLAVEVDCDGRVLRAAGDRRAYATLLLDVGSRAAGLGAAPALAEPHTLLRRRIEMITNDGNAHAALRATGFVAFAALLAALACTGARPQAVPNPLSPDAEDALHQYLPSGAQLKAIAARYEPSVFLQKDQPAQIVALVFDAHDSVVAHATFERTTRGFPVDRMLGKFPAFRDSTFNTGGIVGVGHESYAKAPDDSLPPPNAGSIWIIWASLRPCWSSSRHQIRPCGHDAATRGAD